jgi:hypothetical protein
MVHLHIILVGHLLKGNEKISVRKPKRYVLQIRWILIEYADYFFCILEEEFQKSNYPLHGINKVD